MTSLEIGLLHLSLSCYLYEIIGTLHLLINNKSILTPLMMRCKPYKCSHRSQIELC